MNAEVVERSSSVLIITEERVGKVSKMPGLECDDYERGGADLQHLRQWLVEYDRESLPDVMDALDPRSRSRLLAAFPEPHGHIVFWMPNLVTECKHRSRSLHGSIHDTLRNEIKSIDIKVTSQDMHKLKTRPQVYRTNSVMIDDLKVSMAHVDSVYMKHVFNRSIKNQAKLVKMFLMDLDLDEEGKIKATVNVRTGWEIFKELYALAKALKEGPSLLYKYSIFVVRNADAHVIRLIDVEHDEGRCNEQQHMLAVNTMLEFWRRALMTKIDVLQTPADRK